MLDTTKSSNDQPVNQGPVFQDFDCKPHLHVNAVGSDFPGKFELPVAMLRQSFVCPDFLEQALKEGECQQLAKDEIGDTLVSVVQRSDNYESMRNRTTVFDSTGWSFEDFVVSNMFHQIAEELELGTKVEIESRSVDPKDPYAFLGINAAHLVSDA